MSIITDFGANKTAVDVIKESAVRRIFFSDIYSGVIGKLYRKTWEEIDELKNIDQRYYCSKYYDVDINRYGFKCGISLRFWENKRWINSIDPYGCFQWYFRYWVGRRSLNDKKQIAGWKGIISSFKGKLIKMTKDVR